MNYYSRARDTKEIRQLILMRALLTNDSSILSEQKADEKSYLSDQDNITLTWGQKNNLVASNKEKQNEDKIS